MKPKTICDELYQYCIDWGCIHYGDTPPGIPLTREEKCKLVEWHKQIAPWDTFEIIERNQFMGLELHVLPDGATRRAQIHEKSKQFKKDHPRNKQESSKWPIKN